MQCVSVGQKLLICVDGDEGTVVAACCVLNRLEDDLTRTRHCCFKTSVEHHQIQQKVVGSSTVLTSFLDPAFLHNVLVAHGGFSSSQVFPV